MKRNLLYLILQCLVEAFQHRSPKEPVLQADYNKPPEAASPQVAQAPEVTDQKDVK